MRKKWLAIQQLFPIQILLVYEQKLVQLLIPTCDVTCAYLNVLICLLGVQLLGRIQDSVRGGS